MNSVLERFENRYIPEPNSGCWLWIAGQSSAGYGYFRYEGRNQTAHRVSHLLFKGFIEEGLDACHSCDNPSCVNPDHLFKGTRSDNMKDCVAKGRFENAKVVSSGNMKRNRMRHELKDFCPKGHAYDKGNTYWFNDKRGGLHRGCRICRAEANEKHLGKR